jgi:L-fucose mutarotase/ribose pyranase (RbsD/FucU family)
MIKPVLSFSLAQDSSYKVAQFSCIEEKNRYVAAEMKDLKIQDLYKEYSAALSKTRRKELAKVIDAARYAFYQKWDKAKGSFQIPIDPPDIA